MGELLNEILLELKDSEIDEQVKAICDKVTKEELESMERKDEIIIGPNIFLCLEIPGRTKNEVGFLTLERESVETYIIGHWVRYKPKKDKAETPPYKRVEVFPVKDDRPAKVLKIFAEKLKYMRGD